MTLRLLLYAACLLLLHRLALTMLEGCDTYHTPGILLGVLAHVSATWTMLGAAFCVYGAGWNLFRKGNRL